MQVAHGPPIDLWAIPAGGGEPERLGEMREDDPYLAWSPDGASIAVMGVCALYRVTPGETPRKLARGSSQSQIDWR